MSAYHNHILHNAEINLENGHNVVLDRHWPSEYAYGRVLRPRFADNYDFDKMMVRADHLNPIYIYCRSADGMPSWERYQQTHATPVEGMARYDKSVYFAILTEYRSVFGIIPHLKYSIEENGHNMESFALQLEV